MKKSYLFFILSFICLGLVMVPFCSTINFNVYAYQPEVGVNSVEKFLITATSDSNGTITSSSYVELGGSKKFEFYPSAGYKIKDVKIDGVSFGVIESYTFENVVMAHTISVEYEIKKYTITLTINGNGKIEANKPLQNIEHGEDVAFAISPEIGWELTNVYINGIKISVIDNQLAINNVTADINIQATFTEKTISNKDSNRVGDNNLVLIISIIAVSVVSITIITFAVIGLLEKSKNKKNERPNKYSNSSNSIFTTENMQVNHSEENKQENNNIHNNVQSVNQQSISQTVARPTQQSIQSPVQQQTAQVNPMVGKAISFIKGREQHFVSFCKRYNIDYNANYKNAAIRYYQAYLRSIQK